MRSILFTGRNEVSRTDLALPRPGPDEVVIEVHASGICHTDIEILRGNYGTSSFPVVPGHEFAGVVVELGSEVSGLGTGDRVVVDPNLECGQCRACKRGWAHLCERLGAYGVTRHGGFAERCVVRAASLHPIGDMPFEAAALAEPLGCVLNGLEASRADRARSALIFGAGPMGLLLAIGLQVSGLDDIVLVDIDEARLDLAASFGFGALPAGGTGLGDWHRAADLAVDATGVPSVAENLTAYIANGGSGLYFGVCPSDARIRISPFEMFRRQITLAGSHSLNHNIPKAMAVISAYGNDIARVVSHRLTLDEIAEVLGGRSLAGSLKIQWRRS